MPWNARMIDAPGAIATAAATGVATTASLAEPVLQVEDLSVAFPTERGGSRIVVDRLSLEVRAGEFVGLMGEPGCGKSIAVAAMFGVVRVPGRITGGRVRLLGHDLAGLTEEQARRLRGHDAAIIMQNPRYALHPMLTVGQQIVAAYRAHNQVSRRAAMLHAVEMLRRVGINDPQRRVNALAHELSSGMAQRVLIAIALSSSPRLLIADEPTSGLDVTVQAQILDQMWDNCRRIGSAVLIVTQDLGIIANYCDRALVMKDGTLVEAADTATFFRAPVHPYSRSILALQRAAVAGGGAASAPPPTALPEPLMRIRALTKLFAVRRSKSMVHAVDGVDIDVNEGECVGLVGESGSGKTTVGRCVLRLVPPTGGEIRYRGMDLSNISNRAFLAYRNKLQIVFQDPLYSLNPRMTVGRAVREALDMHSGLTRPQKAARVDELLQLVGLQPEQRDQYPKEMSAGQQQRAAIARALGCDPEFIVLDEPTSALTPQTTAEIVKLLMDLSQRLGLAYLFISHDLTTIRYICHRVVVMYLGQVVESGTVSQVFTDPRHPYSMTLLASHLFPDTADRRVDRAVRTSLKGEIPSPLTENLPKGCYLYGRCPEQEDRCRAERQELRRLPGDRHVRCWKAA
jgi:peptide/nickel transport system ATP-binding protein